jgi:hypothetical protein
MPCQINNVINYLFCKKNISEKQMLDAAYKDRDTRDFYQAKKVLISQN